MRTLEGSNFSGSTSQKSLNCVWVNIGLRKSAKTHKLFPSLPEQLGIFAAAPDKTVRLLLQQPAKRRAIVLGCSLHPGLSNFWPSIRDDTASSSSSLQRPSLICIEQLGVSSESQSSQSWVLPWALAKQIQAVCIHRVERAT